MPYEFALRPRIRLREGFEPPRRARFRLPKVALPVLVYWGIAAAVTHQLLHWHDDPEAPTRVAAPLDNGSPPLRAPAPPPLYDSPPLHDSPPFEAPIAEESPASSETSEPLGSNPPSFARDESDFERRFRRDPREPATARAARAEQDAEEYGRKLALRDDSGASERASGSRHSVAGESVAAPGVLGLSPLDSGAGSSREVERGSQILGAVPPDAPAQVASALPSCEAAQARASQDVTIGGGNGAPDLSREAIARVLDNGVWIARCDIPMTTSVDLCVAIEGGKVVGASVSSRPPSAAINACVKRRAASLSFPYSARLDIARTHF